MGKTIPLYRFEVTATYATPTGRIGSASFTLFKASLDAAVKAASKKVRKAGRSKTVITVTRAYPFPLTLSKTEKE